jgi:hypothetical protein
LLQEFQGSALRACFHFKRAARLEEGKRMAQFTEGKQINVQRYTPTVSPSDALFVLANAPRS